MTQCQQQVETLDIGEVPIDTLSSMPDYILAERDTTDPTDGSHIRAIVREPVRKLFPNVNTDNVFALEANNSALTIPANQVRAVRVVREVSTNVMRYADASHPATMLAIKRDNSTVHCMCCGTVNMEGHSYLIGMQYYTGSNGEPVTDSTSGQKLFIPVSESKLLINL